MTTTPAAEPTPRRTYLNERSPRPGTSLLASAARLTSTTIKARQGTRKQEWQKDAWDMFDLVPELRFLATTLANRLSQARLYVGRLSDDPQEAPIPVDDDPSLTDILASIGPTTSLRKQMIVRLGTNLFVPGEGWLAGIPRYLMPRTLMVGGSLAVQDAEIEPPEDPAAINIADLEWRMLSVDEVTTNGSDVQITMGPSTEEIIKVNPDHIILIRVWRPHPRHWWETDSPTRSLLPVLRELVGLTMHDGAEVDSRLAGAGILIIPQSLQRAMEADSGLSEEELRGRDLFTEALMDAMITPISDRSSASAVVPLTITAPDEVCEKIRHLSFSGPLDQYAGERQDKVIRRLALGADAPPELLLGTGCVDTDTEIMTMRGWQTLDTLDPTDIVLTLNHTTGLSKWQPMLVINRFDVTDHPMLEMKGVGHDSLTTLDHRWPVTSANHGRREFITSQELNTGHRIPTAAPSADLPTEAKYSDDFVELVAWFWTEGSFTPMLPRQWGQATIAQSHETNPVRVDRIRACLDRAFPDGWGNEHARTQKGVSGTSCTVFNLRKHVYATLAEVGGKTVTLDFIRSLTRAQLELFIDVSCQGDGWHYRQGRLDIWQKNADALDAYELALILSGRMVTNSTYAGGRCVSDWKGKSTVRPIKAEIQERTTYTGTVWCPTTENGTWLMRRNGQVAFTGNSMNHWGAWLVLEDVVTTHLEPPLALICDALTTQFLWPVLLDQGRSIDETRRIVIWYDVSDLVVRPNRGTDAMALHEAGVIGDPALRAATGFDESDAPPPVPREVSIALDAAHGAPSLLSDPGLPALVAQIRAVLAGDLSGVSGGVASGSGSDGGSDGPVGGGPGGDVPQPVPGTSGDPAQVPGPGTITSGAARSRAGWRNA